MFGVISTFKCKSKLYIKFRILTQCNNTRIKMGKLADQPGISNGRYNSLKTTFITFVCWCALCLKMSPDNSIYAQKQHENKGDNVKHADTIVMLFTIPRAKSGCQISEPHLLEQGIAYLFRLRQTNLIIYHFYTKHWGGEGLQQIERCLRGNNKKLFK